MPDLVWGLRPPPYQQGDYSMLDFIIILSAFILGFFLWEII